MHANLPTTVLWCQLRYKSQRGNGIPDATIGLCAYNLMNEPWQEQRPDLLGDLRIQMFTRRNLQSIFEEESLKGPYPDEVEGDGIPLFGFAIWEAKKSGGDSHWTALTQLNWKIRCLLEWQANIISAAKSPSIEFVPLVWAFTSVGPTWTVYGCYQSGKKVDGDNYGVSFENRNVRLGR